VAELWRIWSRPLRTAIPSIQTMNTN